MNLTSSISKNKGLLDRGLERIGLDKETAPGLWLLLGGVAISTLVLLLTYGNVFASAAVLGVVGLIIVTFYSIEYSFYLLIGEVLVFDQFSIPGFTPYTLKVEFFRNLKGISYLPHFGAGVLNPLELHLLLIIVCWFFLISLDSNRKVKGAPAWGTAVIFFGWIIYSFIHGMQSGGKFLTALWEVRALFYLGIMYFLVPQIIQSRRQVKIFIWVCIFGITIKALQGIMRFAMLGFSFHGLQTLTNHEDPVFMNTLFILMFGLTLYKSESKQKMALWLLFFPLLIGFFTGQRRAAYASIMVCSVGAFLLQAGNYRWLLLKILFPAVLILAVYGIAGWKSQSTWAEPVQMIKSGIMPMDKNEISRQDYLSNLYRESEDYDLSVTVRNSPVTGIGFGKKYQKPVPLANITFSLRDYIPHNQIFWVIVKTGAIGFFCFWFFFNSYVCRAATEFKNSRDPYLKAVSLMITLAVINQMVVSFFDLQLTYYRNMVYLGSLMGLLPTIITYNNKTQTSQQSTGSEEVEWTVIGTEPKSNGKM